MRHSIFYGFMLIFLLFFASGCSNGIKEKRQQNHAEKTQNKVNQKGSVTPVDKFPELTPEEHYHAIVADSMSLAEVAKVNNIGLPFLKSKLGIPQQLKYNYPVSKLKKNYRFTTEELKTFIEDAKNRSKVLEKKRKQKKQ